MKTIFQKQQLVARIMDLAKENLDNGAEMASSAKLDYERACEKMSRNWGKNPDTSAFEKAIYWGLKSLKYSVGVFHQHYRWAENLAQEYAS